MWNDRGSFSGVAGCQHHPDVEAGQDLQARWSWTEELSDLCRGCA